MTSEELRAKVARAIGAALLDDAPHFDWQVYLGEADAALAVIREAMREPSEEMMDAWENLKHPPHHENRLATKQANIYRAMLAASPLRPASRRPRAMQVETKTPNELDLAGKLRGNAAAVRSGAIGAEDRTWFAGSLERLADAAAALISERDAALARAETLAAQVDDAASQLNQFRIRLDAAIAERDRLRDALVRADQQLDYGQYDAAQDILRVTLTAKEPTDDE